jgi:Domain of unknown function (DUF3883)
MHSAKTGQFFCGSIPEGEKIMAEQDGTGGDWTEEEVNLIVEDYFQMLQLERKGTSFNKAQRLRELQPKLRGRSKGSIEFKRANVSAALVELGYDYIDGYKPRFNRQALLIMAVDAMLKSDMDFSATIRTGMPVLAVDRARKSIIDFSRIVSPIVANRTSRSTVSSPETRYGKPQVVDWGAVAELNREIGRKGEEIALGYERWRLADAGRKDLADQVVWASAEIGDGLGYDIQSFDLDGRRLHIEVKSTTEGPHSPIFFTENERQAAIKYSHSFLLYRIYHLNKNPQMLIYAGAYENFVHFEPVMYSGRFL